VARFALILVCSAAACGRSGFGATPDAVLGDGDLVDAPDAADRPNRAFVTSMPYTGDLGGPLGADAKCQALADAQGIGGTFIALLKAGTYAHSDRLAGSRGWVDLAGTPIADQPTDWYDGRVLHPLRRDETGAVLGFASVWSGYTSGTCDDWTNAVSGNGGVVDTASLYEQFTFSSCTASARLPCVETGHVAPVSEQAQQGRIAFMSTPWTPGGGLADADALCMTEATASQLPGTYKALLEPTGSSAFGRFNLTGTRWIRPDGIPITATAADLAGPLPDYFDSFTSMKADGTHLTRVYTWTGSATNNCSNWNSNNSGVLGASGYGTTTYRSFWLRIIDVGCDQTRPVICLQE